MTRISKFQVNNEILDKLFLLLFEVVGNKFSNKEFADIVHDLFSPVERIMIVKRVAIIYMLMKGIENSIIVDSLKVSPSTISKFQVTIENSKGVVKALNTIVKNEKINDFFENLITEFRGPGTYGVDWKSSWQRKIDYEKRKARGI